MLLAASFRSFNPAFQGKLFVAEPQPSPLWPEDPRITSTAIRSLLTDLGASFLPFENRAFGAGYPYGNNIEALAALPDEPFVFLDSDTLITGSFDDLGFDFARPTASMRRKATWPVLGLYGPGHTPIWASRYANFGLDTAGSLDLTQPDEY
ncbi:MAG: hypothetical protein WCS20_05185 [Alphaproteobacteria bacterium]